MATPNEARLLDNLTSARDALAGFDWLPPRPPAGQAHVLVAQHGHFRTGFRRRSLLLVWRPATESRSPFLATRRGAS